ncbi:MAG: hypothetical protein ACOCZX_04270, partial [Candidatus Bipolaricaulota bacterium]
EIVSSRDQLSPEGLDCPYHFLEFHVSDLAHYQEKAARMKELASDEMHRRETFNRALDNLGEGDWEEALELFEESAKIDVFIPELEDAFAEEASRLSDEARLEIGKTFVHYYKEKYAKRRYERQPERMRSQREEAGVKVIKDLFSLPSD